MCNQWFCSLKKRLSNKKSSTDAERAALPDEGLELQRQGVDRETSNTLLQAIMEAQKLDSSLKERAIEVQRTVEEIGARVGARVSSASAAYGRTDFLNCYCSRLAKRWIPRFK